MGLQSCPRQGRAVEEPLVLETYACVIGMALDDSLTLELERAGLHAAGLEFDAFSIFAHLEVAAKGRGFPEDETVEFGWMRGHVAVECDGHGARHRARSLPIGEREFYIGTHGDTFDGELHAEGFGESLARCGLQSDDGGWLLLGEIDIDGDWGLLRSSVSESELNLARLLGPMGSHRAQGDT